MDGQLSIFDLEKKPEERILEIIKEKPWARLCHGNKTECFEEPEDGICTSLWKCSKRKEYQTINKYLIDHMEGRETLTSPVYGCLIVCEENRPGIDKAIEKAYQYWEWERKDEWNAEK